jgi:hypothetical protein
MVGLVIGLPSSSPSLSPCLVLPSSSPEKSFLVGTDFLFQSINTGAFQEIPGLPKKLRLFQA